MYTLSEKSRIFKTLSKFQACQENVSTLRFIWLSELFSKFIIIERFKFPKQLTLDTLGSKIYHVEPCLTFEVLIMCKLFITGPILEIIKPRSNCVQTLFLRYTHSSRRRALGWLLCIFLLRFGDNKFLTKLIWPRLWWLAQKKETIGTKLKVYWLNAVARNF